MNQTNICPVCGKANDKLDLYCGKCGSVLPKENWDRREEKFNQSPSTPYTVVSETEDTQTILVPKTKEKEKKKWWIQPQRLRPWYHPYEWFFWIGWGFYITFRFFLRELKYYCLWCCWWGPPRDV